MIVLNIDPVPMPRMTRKEALYKSKPCIVEYYAFRDHIKCLKVPIPKPGYHIIFIVPMPPSWSKKKRIQMDGRKNEQVPDKDNYEKGFLDAVFYNVEGRNDSEIYDGRVSKIWGRKGKIIITECRDKLEEILASEDVKGALAC